MSPNEDECDEQLDEAEAGAERAKPIEHQHSHEIQPFSKIARLPIALDVNICEGSIENLNQTLADTATLRDLYKKHQWQAAGSTFYLLHQLLDKHHREQDVLVDAIAERIQVLGGISLAMGRRDRGDDKDSPPAPRSRSSSCAIVLPPRGTRNCLERGRIVRDH
jgi:starvation-inducible DNA-binding protein